MSCKPKIASLLIENCHQIIRHHVFVRIEKIASIVNNSACKVLNSKQSRIDGLLIEQSFIVFVLNLLHTHNK